MNEIRVCYSIVGVKSMIPMYVTVVVNDIKDIDEIKKSVFEKKRGFLCSSIDKLKVHL